MAKNWKIGLLTFLLLVLLLSAGIILSLYTDANAEYQKVPKEMPVHDNGQRFAGSQSCIPCHESVYLTHIETAHHNTSAVASSKGLKGDFNSPNNEVVLTGGRIRLVRENGKHYQYIVNLMHRNTSPSSSEINMVIGSGVKGQSHVTFKGDSLFQLPASYFTLTDSWINSPGFPNFPMKRPVTDDCIKCHVSFAKNISSYAAKNRYDTASIMYGIDCERCHGPLQKHVAYRSGELPESKSDFIVKIDTLDRELRMDVCAQCHAGLRTQQVKGNAFSYVVGERLEDYTKNFSSGRPKIDLDVHGNQYGLLKSSVCYEKSSGMSCTTCHDPHANQRGRTNFFNGKCLECHRQTAKFHNQDLSEDTSFENCIACHMPISPSRIMRVKHKNDSTEQAVDIRTHLIGIYVDGLLQKNN